MTRYPTPTSEGWYWAIWKIADDGTDACRACGHESSDWESPNGLKGETWGVVEVVENCLDETSPEYLMVSVGGVSRWQSLDNFFWGPEVVLPQELKQ